jgi:hypothetical protein
MDHDIFSVTLSDDGWAVVMNELVLASGMNQERAERAVIVAARLAVNRGRTALVTPHEILGIVDGQGRVSGQGGDGA